MRLLAQPNSEGWWWGRTIIEGEAQQWQISRVEKRGDALYFENESDGYDDPLPVGDCAGKGWRSEWLGPIPEPCCANEKLTDGSAMNL